MGVFKINEKALKESQEGKVLVGFNNSADILNNREAEWDLLAGIAVYSQDKTLYALFEKLPETPEEYENAVGGGEKVMASTEATATAAKTTTATTAK